MLDLDTSIAVESVDKYCIAGKCWLLSNCCRCKEKTLQVITGSN